MRRSRGDGVFRISRSTERVRLVVAMREAVVATAFAFAVAAATFAQSGAAAPAAALPKKTAAEMTRIRDGKAGFSDLKVVVAAETAAGRRDSAAWWVAVFEEARKNSKDPGPTAEEVEFLRNETAKPRAPTPGERAIVEKALDRATAQHELKNFVEARRAFATAEAACALRADPSIERSVAAMRELLSKVDMKDADHAAAQRGRPAFEEVRRAASARLKTRLAETTAQYRAAGCRPGRAEIEAALAVARRADVFGADEAYKRRSELRAVGRRVEKTKSVAVFVRTIGKAEFFLDGAPAPVSEVRKSAENEPDGPLVFALLPGDRLDVRCDEAHAAGESNFYVVAVYAAVDGAKAATTAWRRNLAEDPRASEPVLKPAPLGKRRRANEEDWKDEPPDFQESVRKYGEVLETAPDENDVRPFVPIDDDMTRFDRAFANRRLTPDWMAFLGPRCILSFVVPD